MATNKPETPTRYQEIKYRSDQPVRMVGKFTAEHVKRTWKEDFFDKDTKQVITVDRYETIITRGQEISHDMIPKILFHMQAGELKDILVSNQRRMRDQVKRTHPTPFIVNLHMGDRGCKVIVQATSIKQAINIAADWGRTNRRGTLRGCTSQDGERPYHYRRLTPKVRTRGTNQRRGSNGPR